MGPDPGFTCISSVVAAKAVVGTRANELAENESDKEPSKSSSAPPPPVGTVTFDVVGAAATENKQITQKKS